MEKLFGLVFGLARQVDAQLLQDIFIHRCEDNGGMRLASAQLV